MSSPSRTLPRAALVGLAAGLLLAAATLVVLALQRRATPCESPGTEECVFEQQTAAEIARLQSLGALGFSLVGAGLLVAARRGRAAEPRP